MQDLNNLNTKKIPNFELTPFKKREVKQLEAYYKQGGKWYKVSEIRTRFSDKKGGK